MGAVRHKSRLTAASEKSRARFLDALAGPAAGSVLKAAAVAGVSRTMPYLWARRDAAFADQMAAAKAAGKALYLAELEEEVHRRAVLGVEEPVFQKGLHVGTIRRYSDLLLMFVTKRHDPSYRDNTPLPDTQTRSLVRMTQLQPDGSQQIVEIGNTGTPLALPNPRDGTDQDKHE